MANTLTPEEAAKVRELESQLDFLKAPKKTEPEKPAETEAEKPAGTEQQKAAPSDEKQPASGNEPVAVNPYNPLLAASRPEQDKGNDGSSASARKPGEMSALDRARASRFAPPRHVLQQAAADNAAAVKKEEPAQPPKAAEEKKEDPERPRPEGPKPVGPQPAGPQPALKLAMTVDEAKKQGLIAPGTYGKPADDAQALKGDTKEIPNIPGPVNIKDAAAKEPEKAKAHPAEPIKNPLPVPKKHVAKDMEFDIEVPLSDMHFDVVDMSGIDFFDIN